MCCARPRTQAAERDPPAPPDDVRLDAGDEHLEGTPQANEPIPGLYAVGEAAGFGGGGVHGKRSLEGTFLGGCVFSGRLAAAAIAGAELPLRIPPRID